MFRGEKNKHSRENRSGGENTDRGLLDRLRRIGSEPASEGGQEDDRLLAKELARVSRTPVSETDSQVSSESHRNALDVIHNYNNALTEKLARYIADRYKHKKVTITPPGDTIGKGLETAKSVSLFAKNSAIFGASALTSMFGVRNLGPGGMGITSPTVLGLTALVPILYGGFKLVKSEFDLSFKLRMSEMLRNFDKAIDNGELSDDEQQHIDMLLDTRPNFEENTTERFRNAIKFASRGKFRLAGAGLTAGLTTKDGNTELVELEKIIRRFRPWPTTPIVRVASEMVTGAAGAVAVFGGVDSWLHPFQNAPGGLSGGGFISELAQGHYVDAVKQVAQNGFDGAKQAVTAVNALIH